MPTLPVLISRSGGPLFEPTGRNTAAAVALASLRTLSEYGDELVLVVPSDHEISTPRQFWQSIEAGAAAANAGRLVVFHSADSARDWLRLYRGRGGQGGVFDVTRFVEKPDVATAQTYLDAGTFYWNTGIFLFRAGAMRDAFAVYEPKIWQATEAAYKRGDQRPFGPLHARWNSIPRFRRPRSTMPSWSAAKDIAMVPAGFAERPGAPGSRCSMSDRPTSTATSSSAMSSPSIAKTPISAATAACSAIGMKRCGHVPTADATFVAPVSHSQHVTEDR
ncbi:sugar phosphate nucleotidyltransferase [Mesorhizobium atlanticum]